MARGDRPERLTSYVKDRVGEYFLGTVSYTETDHELHDVSRDVAPAYTDDVVADLVDLLRGHHEVGGPKDPQIPAGSLQTAVYVLEDAIVIHYMVTETEGIAIAMTPDAGRNLFRFVEETRRHLGTAD